MTPCCKDTDHNGLPHTLICDEKCHRRTKTAPAKPTIDEQILQNQLAEADRRAAGVCENLGNASISDHEAGGCYGCATAIERMELP